MLYRSIYIGNPAHLKLKDKQLKITDPTTQTVPKYAHALLSITKLQNLKAIHNLLGNANIWRTVVINHKTIKFESNSQQQTRMFISRISCYQSQNYKIWKQFTTRKHFTIEKVPLLSITKLQNLKAIHNMTPIYSKIYPVVINHKTTKFESNSQR